jgi:hypothetical protein
VHRAAGRDQQDPLGVHQGLKAFIRVAVRRTGGDLPRIATAGKPASHVFGRGGLVLIFHLPSAEADLCRCSTIFGRKRFEDISLNAFDSARRAWEPDLSAIGCAAVVDLGGAQCQADRIHRFGCRCPADRRQAGLPRLRQKQICVDVSTVFGGSRSVSIFHLSSTEADLCRCSIIFGRKQICVDVPPSSAESGLMTYPSTLLILPAGRGSLTCRRSAAQQSWIRAARSVSGRTRSRFSGSIVL